MERAVRRRQGGVSGISNEEKIRKAIDSIPSGRVSTYKKIGQQVYRHDNAGQTVGNLISDEMEGWHRVVRSDRSLSKGAPRSQRACLEHERISFDPNGKVQKKHLIGQDTDGRWCR